MLFRLTIADHTLVMLSEHVFGETDPPPPRNHPARLLTQTQALHAQERHPARNHNLRARRHRPPLRRMTIAYKEMLMWLILFDVCLFDHIKQCTIFSKPSCSKGVTRICG